MPSFKGMVYSPQEPTTNFSILHVPGPAPRILLVPYQRHWLFPSVHIIVLIQSLSPLNTKVTKCLASADLVPKMMTFRPRIHRSNIVRCTCAEFLRLSIELQHDAE